jgi:WD40 repeat protein/basic membrane lipoprotein Med (substrate-binding protein (PBP1-ABC) superfamily)
VNILEGEFLAASKDLAERRQQERERQLRRLRWLAAGMAAMLVVAILSAVFSFNQRSLAQREAHLAASRGLAAAALNNLEGDPELGILLALEAVAEARDNGQPVPREALEALHHSLQVSRLEMVIEAHPGGVRELAYSPDGKRLASVGKDRMLKVWDASSGQLLDSGRATNVESTCVAFSPDGKYIATADHDMTAKIWDSRTLAQIATLEGHDTGLLTLTFSPDGERLVTSTSNMWEGLFVWDIASGQKIGEFFVNNLQVPEAIAFSPDGKWAAAANTYGQVHLWDATTYDEIRSLGSGEFYMFGMAISPDGSRLAASDSENKVIIWDTSSWEELLSFYAHADWMLDIEFSPDGNRLATSSLDGKAKIWDAATGQELLLLAGHTDGILSLAFDPSGKHLATASMDGTLRIWNVSLSQEWLSSPTDGYAGHIAFSPDGSLLAAGSGYQGKIRLWNLETGEETGFLTSAGHPGGVDAVTFSPDGAQLASVGVDDSLKIWDIDSGQLINLKEEVEISEVGDVMYSPDGSLLVISGSGTTFELLDAATLQKLAEFPNKDVADAIAFSPDGNLLASTTRSGVTRVWDLRTEEEIQTLHVQSGWLADLTFNPDGDSLAIAGNDGTVSVWQLGDDQPRLTLRGNSAPVMGVAYSPNGSHIATASQDGSARLWDAASGEEMLLINPEGGLGLVDVTFSPDGKRLATSADDAVRVYLLEIDDLVSLAEARLSRAITPQECQRFLPASRCERPVSPTPTPESVVEIEATERICAVSDPVGITKFSYFHQTYLGVKEAGERHNWEWLVFIPEVYEVDPQEFERTLNADCDLIVGLGVQFFDELKVSAIQHPRQRFLFLDDYFDPPLENVWSTTYASDQGAFLAGYLAAAMTESGVIGTFGGDNIPAVTDFMDGFEAGMHYYNQRYQAEVKLVGWDSATREGYLHSGFFEPEPGQELTTRLLEQGADIIFPVAGSITGFGALVAVTESQTGYVIGVDMDLAELHPQFADVILTSVKKRYDLSVIRAVDALAEGEFVGGNHQGTLETGEVDLAPFHELESLIPDNIKAELDQIKADIIAGEIQTKPGGQ